MAGGPKQGCSGYEGRRPVVAEGASAAHCPYWIAEQAGIAVHSGGMEIQNQDKRTLVLILRELVTQLRHSLAPKGRIAHWDAGHEKDGSGNPTREARLPFTCQDIDHGELSAFIKADALSVLRLVRVFNSGTHRVEPKLTDGQLRAIIARVEGLVVSMLGCVER